MKMDKKQYNNVIDWTVSHEPSAQKEESLTTARAVFNNMGIPLPSGSMKEVYETLGTDNYMGWRSCTMQEAQAAADNGTAAIGIREDKIVVLGQVRISTARKVEDNGYLPITHYSEWHGNNSVENRDAGIAMKLLNAQENAKYVAGYLAYIIDLWEQEYPYISCDAEVLATLYNIGEMGSNNAGPHPNPGSNEFGRFASDHRQLLQSLL